MKTIGKKLLAFQKELPAISKDGENPFFKKDGKGIAYATIDNILSIVKPILNKIELVLTQPIENGELSTIITDVDSGESVKSTIKLPEGLSPQQLGSAITYFRRYTLGSLLSLQLADDDDANSTTPTKTEKKPDAGSENQKKWLNPGTKNWDAAIVKMKEGSVTLEKVKEHYNMSKVNEEKFMAQVNTKS